MKNNRKKVKCHDVCTGCSCCLLSCPVWNRTRDRSLTPQGRNKALQGGATLEDIAEAIDSCLLCGACEPNCPEENDITGLTLEHRQLLNQSRKSYPSWYPETALKSARDIAAPYKGAVLLAGSALKDDKALCDIILKRLGKNSILAKDDGGDILRSMEAGLPAGGSRIADFVAPLKQAELLVTGAGGLQRHLKEWLPDKKTAGLGEMLLSMDCIRRCLSSQDMYVIECRGYHSDYARLVGFYNNVRIETGAQFNLDLQRMAIPTGSSSIQAETEMKSAGCVEQVKWILQGRKIKRIVVEDVADIKAFKLATGIPVVHVARLAE